MKKPIYIPLFFVAIYACGSKNVPQEQSGQVDKIPGHKTQLSEEEMKSLDSLNIHFQLRGDCYAYSSDKNAQPSNGEAHSPNLPKKVDDSFPKKKGLYLVINQDELVQYDEAILGCKLYLVNTTDTIAKLHASDSRLYIVAEALNEKNEWAPITYLPSSGCGNSSHTVILDKQEYWEFLIPVFKGNFKTKLRYTLTLNKEKRLSSNEIPVFINKEQLDPENKQGHTPTNIMDPYND